MTIADGEVGMTEDDVIARANIIANLLHFPDFVTACVVADGIELRLCA